MILTALLLVMAIQEEPTVVRQTRVPIERVLGRNIRLDDREKKAVKEARRHDREMEKALRRLRVDPRFMIPTKRTKAKPMRTLPPNATRY